MSSFGGLPGGRGPRHGEDASVNQRESDAQRAKQLPSHFTPIWTNAIDGPGLATNTTRALAATTLHLCLTFPPAQAIEIRSVRLNVTAVAGASTIYSAIYVFQHSTLLFTKIANSEVRIAALGGAASLRSTFSSSYTLVPSDADTVYFLGLAYTGNQPTVTAGTSNLISVMNCFRQFPLPAALLAANNGKLPNRFLWANTTALTGNIPIVSYLSQRWDDLL